MTDELGRWLERTIAKQVAEALDAVRLRATYDPSPDEILRERVAAAMYDDLSRRAHIDETWENGAGPGTKRHYRQQAEAAIKAMREAKP